MPPGGARVRPPCRLLALHDGPVNVRDMVRAEQETLRATLDSLTTDEWDHPSLCGNWRVRDVVAHLISMNRAGVIGFLQATASIHWFNATGVRRRVQKTPAELLAELDTVMGMRGFGRVVPPSAMLVEWLVHSQDIHRALGVRRQISPGPLLILLPRCVSLASFVPSFGFTGGRWRARGLRLQATDLDWSWGRGLDVSGGGEAILMAVLGRSAVVADLAGSGVPVLAARTDRPPPSSIEPAP